MKKLNPLATPDQQRLSIKAIERRGLRAVRYRTEDDVRHGWIVGEEGKTVRVQLIGEERVRRVTGDERRYLEEV